MSGESWSYIAHSSSKGSFLSSVLLLESELFWLSDFCMFLVSPVEQDKYFHSLCIVHNSSYSQFSNSRFLKETKYFRIKFNTIRIPSRKKYLHHLPQTEKHILTKNTFPHHAFHIYVWLQNTLPYKADYEVNELWFQIYLYVFSLFKGKKE